MTTEAFLDQYAAEGAIKRPITVEEVAALAVVVASDAGSGITGARLSSMVERPPTKTNSGLGVRRVNPSDSSSPSYFTSHTLSTGN